MIMKMIMIMITMDSSPTWTKTYQAKDLVRLNDSFTLFPIWRAMIFIMSSGSFLNFPDTAQSNCAWSYNHWNTNNGPVKI